MTAHSLVDLLDRIECAQANARGIAAIISLGDMSLVAPDDVSSAANAILEQLDIAIAAAAEMDKIVAGQPQESTP